MVISHHSLCGRCKLTTDRFGQSSNFAFGVEAEKSSKWLAVEEPTIEATLSQRLLLEPVARTITSAST